MKPPQKSAIWFSIGIFISALAIFANNVGLDPNDAWGRWRTTLLLVGIFIVLCAALYLHRYKSIENKAGALSAWIRHTVPALWWSKRSSTHQLAILSIPLVLLVIIVYVWFISVGQWTKWPTITAYYDWLATAFTHGHTHIEIQPDPKLLALANPYDPRQRSGIPTPLDISFFNRKFYLYWGPVPALLLAIVRPFLQGEIGDQYLVFGFITGIFIVQVLVLFELWNEAYRQLPVWVFLATIPVVGMILPYNWMLMTPRVYDAAIAGSQFFLITGFYMALLVMRSPSFQFGKLTVIGSLLAFAIGSRLTQIVPAGFLAALTLWGLYHEKKIARSFKGLLQAALAVGAPIGIGILLLGWYNWTRFGNPLETGFRYALAGPYLQSYGSRFFSPAFAIQNLYNYFLNPFTTREIFPFIKLHLGHNTSILSFISLPPIYNSDELAGLFYSAPFIIFSVIAITSTVKSLPDKNRKNREGDGFFSHWMLTSLTIIFIAAFAPLMIFFWATTRYIADFMPALATLSVVGFWEGIKILEKRPAAKIFFGLLGVALAGITIIVSTLVAASSHMAHFRAINPALLERLIRVFGG